MRKNRTIAVLPCVLLMVLVTPAVPSGLAGAALDSLVTPAERAFVLNELARIDPPERSRDLSQYGEHQLELGGGFYGMLPAQLADADSIPLPVGEAGRLEAGLYLARQRAVNLAAMQKVNPEYPLAFKGESLATFLERVGPGPDTPADGLNLELDTSALDGFFAALSDGEVTEHEAAALAGLASNRAMLEHRRNLGYVPEPLPDSTSLAEMIRIAGSPDPLDRLWCWINPQNAFGYADLAQNAEGYEAFLSDIDAHRRQLVAAVLSRVARYAPDGVQFEGRFAFTVGWAIRGWATPEMAGLNVEQVKDDWQHLFGTLVEETYHRLQLELCPTSTGTPAREFEDLVAVETGDARYDRLYELLTYTMLEGCANLARGRFADPGLAAQAPAGGQLVGRFVDDVVTGGNLDGADALISEGLKGNGPLYGLGWKLASLIGQEDGDGAVAAYQARGPVEFARHGAMLATGAGEPLLSPGVVAAIDTLASRLASNMPPPGR